MHSSPAKVNHVLLDDSNSIKTAVVVVPDRQLSLAIGKEGQNARLAAKLTGWRIDIKSDSEAMHEGIDRLAAEQAREGRSTDLFDVVQRFLEDDKKPAPQTEDLFAKAAQALEEQDSQTYRRSTPDWTRRRKCRNCPWIGRRWKPCGPRGRPAGRNHAHRRIPGTGMKNRMTELVAEVELESE